MMPAYFGCTSVLNVELYSRHSVVKCIFMVCFGCVCSVEKYRKCEPLSASGNTKAGDPLINLDSKKCHIWPCTLLSCILLFLWSHHLPGEEWTHLFCVLQVIPQISKQEWQPWPTSSRYSGMTTTWWCSRWEHSPNASCVSWHISFKLLNLFKRLWFCL